MPTGSGQPYSDQPTHSQSFHPTGPVKVTIVVAWADGTQFQFSCDRFSYSTRGHGYLEMQGVVKDGYPDRLIVPFDNVRWWGVK